MSTIEQLLSLGALAIMLTFVRLGTAIMIMPGVGDSFVPANVRLLIALAISVMLAPMVMADLPADIPQDGRLFILIVQEFIIGALIGTVARIFMAALDVAGMIISLQSGLGNAQIFNPNAATQGSLIGAFLSVTGAVVLFATQLHHLLFYGLVESYTMFPVGEVPPAGSMAQLVASAVTSSFEIGFKLAIPFIIIALILYVGMGVLSRLMPQVQVFLLALPMQILLATLTLSIVISGMFMFWAQEFERAILVFFGG